MSDIKIGCSQITWNQFRPQDMPGAERETRILSEIAQAGYAGAPAGPRSGRTAAETAALYAEHGLAPAPGYLGADFWIADQEASILARAVELACYARDVGCTELYVAAGGFDSYRTQRGKTRRDVSGHVRPEDRITDAELAQFARTLNRVGETTLECGVSSCFHNHVGSVVETRAEIDALFSLIDRSLVFQGPDIGHLAWAGADPVQFCRDYSDSIRSVHLKDVNPTVLEQGVANEWDYGTFTANGIWCELGEGFGCGRYT